MDGVKLLSAIFEPQDTVLLRPIETWSEGTARRSRVDFKGIEYVLLGTHEGNGTWRAVDVLPAVLKNAVARTDKSLANLFYGVCPRAGAERFDEAWAIRTVRCLWSDVDDAEPQDAASRVKDAGLPPPSAVVSSGHGSHLYWILAEPWLIDDVDEPPPVRREKVTIGEKTVSRKYITEAETGEKLYLDARQNVPQLSEKATFIQDVLSGVAGKIGGDHTTDLSRLLRIPGTLNRKDQRNGTLPTRCYLVALHPDRRHSIDDFRHLVEAAPSKKRRIQIAKFPLPEVTGRLTPKRKDALNQAAWKCGNVPIGERSETDFKTVCWAIEKGYPQSAVWDALSTVGKFAERGQGYFDLTWSAAAMHVRERMLAGREKPAVDRTGRTCVYWQPTDETADVLERITEVMVGRGDTFNRTNSVAFVHNDEIHPVITPDELAGIFVCSAEFATIGDKGLRYEPLPRRFASPWLTSPMTLGQLPRLTVWSKNPVYTPDWELVPHGYHAPTGIYYAGPTILPKNTTSTIDRLLGEFYWREQADHTNYLAMLLTALMIPRFIGGEKPGVVFIGNQPSLGKTKLAQLIAILRDGRAADTVTYTPDDTELEKRLGTIVRAGATTIIIDNVKSGRRASLIESPALERTITDHTLSFRLLGANRQIKAENSLIVAITANSPQVGRDLITRCVPVNLFCEGSPWKRKYDIKSPERFAMENRTTLLGELCGMVEKWKQAGKPHGDVSSRFGDGGWSEIVGGILGECGYSDFMTNADQSASEMDSVREQFTDLVIAMAEAGPAGYAATGLLDLCDANGLLQDELGRGTERSRAIRMGILASRFKADAFRIEQDEQLVFVVERDSHLNANVFSVLREARSSKNISQI